MSLLNITSVIILAKKNLSNYHVQVTHQGGTHGLHPAGQHVSVPRITARLWTILHEVWGAKPKLHHESLPQGAPPHLIWRGLPESTLWVARSNEGLSWEPLLRRLRLASRSFQAANSLADTNRGFFLFQKNKAKALC